MSILRKSLEEITREDIEELSISEARENSELEFKGTLPFIPQKGQAQTADRWIERGDRIGDYARDAILSELVSFANTEGGTLVLGVHESNTEPRHAIKLEALPNCSTLVKRILDAAEDVVEPRIPTISGRAFPIEEGGAGYIVLRVARSLFGPHRLRSTGHFYVRRGERCVKMDVREIKELTLELARTGDKIEEGFQERRNASAQTFVNLRAAEDKGGLGPLLIRVSALPLNLAVISELTSNQNLWWTGDRFSIRVGNADYDCAYPAREFDQTPEIRLRSLIKFNDPESGGCMRLLRSDGLVEFSLIHPKTEPRMSGRVVARLYMSWFISLLVGAIAQVHLLRKMLAWDAIEYGLEIEVMSDQPLELAWQDRGFSGRKIKSDMPIFLPRYSISPSTNYDDIVAAAIKDLFNASGSSYDGDLTVPWSQLGVA